LFAYLDTYGTCHYGSMLYDFQKGKMKKRKIKNSLAEKNDRIELSNNSKRMTILVTNYHLPSTK
jgi:hypothetical protein